MKNRPPPIVEPMPVGDEDACRSILGGVIAGLASDGDSVMLVLEDGRHIVFENCDRILIEITTKFRAH